MNTPQQPSGFLTFLRSKFAGMKQPVEEEALARDEKRYRFKGAVFERRSYFMSSVLDRMWELFPGMPHYPVFGTWLPGLGYILVHSAQHPNHVDVVVLDRQKRALRQDLDEHLKILESFEFDRRTGAVTRQPSPEAYQHSLRAVRSVLQALPTEL